MLRGQTSRAIKRAFRVKVKVARGEGEAAREVLRGHTPKLKQRARLAARESGTVSELSQAWLRNKGLAW